LSQGPVGANAGTGHTHLLPPGAQSTQRTLLQVCLQ
jgi:hypothetical protein